MQENENSQPSGNPPSGQTAPSQPPSSTGGQKVIQPTPELIQELQAQQQQAAAQPAQPVVGADTSSATQVQAQNVYPQPTAPSMGGQMQVGMSASQLGLNQPKREFNVKGLVVKVVVGLIALGAVFAVLVFTNIIALSQFKTVNYTNSSGTHYSLTFYTKHGTKTLKSGNTSLVSKVSEGGKYPITLSIANGNESGYSRAKDCTGSGFTKVFDVQNNNLNQKISVCNFALGQSAPNGVYIAGILYNNQTSIVTISQDLSGVDLSSQSGAQQSLPKFGLDPYQDDIKTIIASIKIE